MIYFLTSSLTLCGITIENIFVFSISSKYELFQSTCGRGPHYMRTFYLRFRVYVIEIMAFQKFRGMHPTIYQCYLSNNGPRHTQYFCTQH